MDFDVWGWGGDKIFYSVSLFDFCFSLFVIFAENWIHFVCFCFADKDAVSGAWVNYLTHRGANRAIKVWRFMRSLKMEMCLRESVLVYWIRMEILQMWNLFVLRGANFC